MSRYILKVPAWQLFLAFVVGLFAAEAAALTIARFLEWNTQYGPYPTLRFGLVTLLLWTYPYLVGKAISQRARTARHRRVLAIILLAIFNNALSVYLTESFGPAWYIVLITVLVNIFCLLEVLSYPARELKSLQLKRRAQLPEYGRELLTFAAWPICVWWLQPALARAVRDQAEQ